MCPCWALWWMLGTQKGPTAMALKELTVQGERVKGAEIRTGKGEGGVRWGSPETMQLGD